MSLTCAVVGPVCFAWSRSFSYMLQWVFVHARSNTVGFVSLYVDYFCVFLQLDIDWLTDLVHCISWLRGGEHCIEKKGKWVWLERKSVSWRKYGDQPCKRMLQNNRILNKSKTSTSSKWVFPRKGCSLMSKLIVLRSIPHPNTIMLTNIIMQWTNLIILHFYVILLVFKIEIDL